MQTLQEIENQIEKLGDNAKTFGGRKEIKALPKILMAGEVIKGVISGLMNKKTWLIVCTTRRILFLDKGFLWGLTVSEIPLEKVNSIESKTHMFTGSIKIWDGASEVHVDRVWRSGVLSFVESVNLELEHLRNKDQKSPAIDAITQIEKLSALREKNAITEEEYVAQKLKLLKLV